MIHELKNWLLFPFARSCEKGQRAKHGAQLLSQNEVYTDQQGKNSEYKVCYVEGNECKGLLGWVGSFLLDVRTYCISTFFTSCNLRLSFSKYLI